MNENKFEKKEILLTTTETISSDTLKEIIYGNGGFPKDNRFLPDEKGGVFKYFDLNDLNGFVHPLDKKNEKFYSVIKIGEKIIGLCLLQENPDRERTIGINFLSIDPEYQGQGYASKLADEAFKFAKNKGYSILGTPYSDEGDKKLKPLFIKLANKYSVNFIDPYEGILK